MQRQPFVAEFSERVKHGDVGYVGKGLSRDAREPHHVGAIHVLEGPLDVAVRTAAVFFVFVGRKLLRGVEDEVIGPREISQVKNRIHFHEGSLAAQEVAAHAHGW